MHDDPEGRGAEHARVYRLVEAQETSGRSGTAGAFDRLCAAAVVDLDLMAAAVSHPPSPGVHLVEASSDEAARRLEELQFDTGEGPTSEACRLRRPVLVPDLGGALARWPGFVQSAAGAGVGAVFAFPLQVGAAMLGAFTLYRGPPVPLTPPQLRTGLLLAEVGVELIIDDAGHATMSSFTDALDGQAQVYQAQGMVMVQLDLTLSEALARMRAHAHAHDLTLTALSASIIDGTTTFTQDGPAS